VSLNRIKRQSFLQTFNFITKQTSKLRQLLMNSTNIGELGGKSISVSIGSNNTLKHLELMSNNVKLTGASALGRGLMVNSTIEEVNLAMNSLALEGAAALAECLKVNKTIKTLNVHTNNFNYDAIVKISQALKVNSTLKTLNLSFNNIVQGVYDLLNSINNDVSCLENLIIKVSFTITFHFTPDLCQEKTDSEWSFIGFISKTEYTDAETFSTDYRAHPAAEEVSL
jgi:hypothetical protein